MSELLQLKCLSDVKKLISDIQTYRARPAIRGQHPTLYPERLEGKYRTIQGVRICDYQFCPDEKWVLPNEKWDCRFLLHGTTCNLFMGCSKNAQRRNLLIFIGFYPKQIYLQDWPLLRIKETPVIIS